MGSRVPSRSNNNVVIMDCRLLQEPAAGQVDRVAGDIVGLIGCQEYEGIRNLLRCAEALHGDELHMQIIVVRVVSRRHIRLNSAGRNGIYRNIVLCQLVSHRAGPANRSGLRSCVAGSCPARAHWRSGRLQRKY